MVDAVVVGVVVVDVVVADGDAEDMATVSHCHMC